MSTIWNWLDEGLSIPTRRSWRQKLCMWCGKRLALRHKYVTLAKSSVVHPDAKINPRQGEIRMGENCSVAAGAIVQGNVTLGENCSIQTGTLLVGYGSRENPTGLIRIGNDVRIAPMVMMIAANHVFEDAQKPIHQQGLKNAPITIEDDVWIAGRVSIMAGVTIGRGSIIGAGAVVTSDIGPMSIAVGIPAKVIGQRD